MRNSALIKSTVFLLSFLIIAGNLQLFPQINYLEDQFKLASYYYTNKEYNKAVNTLRKIISGIRKEDQAEILPEVEVRKRRLRGWTYLLMSAANERLEKLPQARRNYIAARPLLEKPNLPGLDLSMLPVFNEIIVKEWKGPAVFEQSANKVTRKKRMNPVLKVAIVGVVLTALVIITGLKSKKETGPAILEVSVDQLSKNLSGTSWTITLLLKNSGETPMDIDLITVIPVDSNLDETKLWQKPVGHNPLAVSPGQSRLFYDSFNAQYYKDVEKVHVDVYGSDYKFRNYYKRIEVKLE